MSAVDNLIKQILASSNTSKWKGEGFGSAEANAADMAKLLNEIGITDIKQFGLINKTVDEEVQPDGQGGFIDSKGNPVDPKLVKEESQSGESGDRVFYTAPTGTTQVYGNKVTGQEIGNSYGERQNENAWGGTYTGEGNTAYRVYIDAQGNPQFYTTAASSNDLANLMQDLGPIGQIGLAIATGGLSIPQQIAANFALQVMSGKDIGDALKGAAASYAMSKLPGLDVMKESSKFLNGLDDTGILSSTFKNAAMSGAKALITGKDFGEALRTGALTGGVNGALNAMLDTDEYKDLTKDLSASQRKMVVNAVTGAISGKPLDQVVINTAMSAARDAAAKAQTENQVLDPYFKTSGNKSGDGDLNALLDSITKTTDSSSTSPSNQEILDMIGYTGDTSKDLTVPDDKTVTVVSEKDADNTSLEDILSPYKKVLPDASIDAGKITVTGNRETDDVDSDLSKTLNPNEVTDLGKQVITAKKPVTQELDLSVEPIKLDVPDLKLEDIVADTTKVDDKTKVTPSNKVTVTPDKVATPETPFVSTGQAPPPSQDPYAKVKFMQDIFGPELSNQFLTDVSMQTPKSNDLEALLRLLRG